MSENEAKMKPRYTTFLNAEIREWEKELNAVGKFRAEKSVICVCGSGLPVLNRSGLCSACEAYNAAAEAQRAAAESFAIARCEGYLLGTAWLNQHGAFANNKNHSGIQVATPEEVAPFAALTTVARAAAIKSDSLESEKGFGR